MILSRKNWKDFLLSRFKLKILRLSKGIVFLRTGLINVLVNLEIKLFMIYFLRKHSLNRRRKTVKKRKKNNLM